MGVALESNDILSMEYYTDTNRIILKQKYNGFTNNMYSIAMAEVLSRITKNASHWFDDDDQLVVEYCFDNSADFRKACNITETLSITIEYDEGSDIVLH